MLKRIYKFPMMAGVTQYGETLDYVGDDYVCSHCDGHTDASNDPMDKDWHRQGCLVVWYMMKGQPSTDRWMRIGWSPEAQSFLSSRVNAVPTT